MKAKFLRASLLFGFFSLFMLAVSGHAVTVTLDAIDSDMFRINHNNYSGERNYNNRYESLNISNTYFYNGYLKFGLSDVPDNAIINSIIFSNKTGGTVGNAMCGVWHSSNDSWSSSSYEGFIPVLDMQVAGAQKINAAGCYNTWTLSNLNNWLAKDLIDNYLTLALVETVNCGDSNFFGASYAGANTLTIDYSLAPTHTPVPEPSGMLLMGLGLAGIAGFGKRRFLSRNPGK